MGQLIRKVLRSVLPPGAIKILMDYFWAHNDLAKKYPKSMIGNPLFLNPAFIELAPYTKLHDNVRIISCKGKVYVKKFSAIAAGTCFIPGTHIPTVGLPQCLSGLHINDQATNIIIHEDCWIGAECMFLQHAEIGRGAIVGARSVVTKTLPPYSVIAGSPAKIIAARFNIEQIMAHEQLLYPEHERLSRTYLEELFDTHYQGIRTLGISEIAPEDVEKLINARQKIGLD